MQGDQQYQNNQSGRFGMSAITIGIIGTLIMIIFIFMEMPLALSFFASGLIGIVMLVGPGMGLNYLQSIPFSKAASYTFAVMPLFMLMGDIAVAGKLTTDAYAAARKWLGRVPGGLAVTSTVTSAIFGAICGSLPATAMVMSQMAWPEMRKYGYDAKLGLGSIAAAAPIAILIPPSIPLILYGLLSDTSIGKLFMAGWIPGLLMTLALCCTVFIMVLRNPKIAPRAEKSSLKEKMISLKGTWAILLLVIAIMYCIWGGVTTVNEAAGVGAMLCMIIVFSKHRLDFKSMAWAFLKSVTFGGSMIFLLVGVQIYSVFMTLSGIPQTMASWILGLSLSPFAIIWVMLVIYLILGCFIDTPPIQMLCVPLFAPVVSAMGYDLVWFGILTTICCGLGSITPPVGMSLFVIHGLFREEPITTMYKGIIPFIIVSFVVLILVACFPQLALWLPNLMV
jgi:tripartite ATP-independent transporter DctM subunit